MNPIFTKLLQNTSAIRPFLQFYRDTYGLDSLAVFQNLPFEHQIGVYLTYFETIYNLYIVSSPKGYSIHFVDNRNIPLSGRDSMDYNHYRFDNNEPKSIIYSYQLAIIWLFENYNLPF
jgi:hypothetical protein